MTLQEAIKQIKESYKEFGVYDPYIVINQAIELMRVQSEVELTEILKRIVEDDNFCLQIKIIT